jgi:glutathione S-transferase
VKVRLALEHKRIPHELEDIHPLDRRVVYRVSRQLGVPVLIDGDRTVIGSTACVLHVEERYPDPPLLPSDPSARAEVLLLEDWADRAFMEAARRVAYWNILTTAGLLGELFFPESSGAGRAAKVAVAKQIIARRFGISARRYRRDAAEMRELARIALARLASRRFLVGDSLTLADLGLAAMTALLATDPELRGDPAVAALLAWGEPLVGAELVALYREHRRPRRRTSDSEH